MCLAPCVTTPFYFSSFSPRSLFFSLDINVCARTNRSPFVYLFPSDFSMVAHTGNSTMTTTSSTNLPTTNYISPTLKMNLPQNLCTRIRKQNVIPRRLSFCILVHSIDSWTKDDVQKWIEYCIDEYSLGDVNLNEFEMNGKFFTVFLLFYSNKKKKNKKKKKFELVILTCFSLSLQVKHYYY